MATSAFDNISRKAHDILRDDIVTIGIKRKAVCGNFVTLRPNLRHQSSVAPYSSDNGRKFISLLSTDLQSIHRTLLAWRYVYTSAKAWYGCTLFWYLAPADMISPCSDLDSLGNTNNKQKTIHKVRLMVYFPMKTVSFLRFPIMNVNERNFAVSNNNSKKFL